MTNNETLQTLEDQLVEALRDRDLYKKWNEETRKALEDLIAKSLKISEERDDYRKVLEKINEPFQGFQRKVLADEILKKYS